MVKYFFNKFALAFNLIIGIGSVIALLFMYVLQYFGGFKPCYLCYVQRILCIVSIASFILCYASGFIKSFARNKNVNSSTALSVVNTLIIIVMNAVAWYQIGLEKHWITSKLRCAAINTTDIAGVDLAISDKIIRCDVPQYFLNISIALWTVAALSILLLLTIAYWLSGSYKKNSLAYISK